MIGFEQILDSACWVRPEILVGARDLIVQTRKRKVKKEDEGEKCVMEQMFRYGKCNVDKSGIGLDG